MKQQSIEFKEIESSFDRINSMGKEVIFLGFKTEKSFDKSIFDKYFDEIEINSKKGTYLFVKGENYLTIPFENFAMCFEQSCIYLLEKNLFVKKDVQRYFDSFFTPYLQIDRRKKLIKFPNYFDTSMILKIFILDSSSVDDNSILSVSLNKSKVNK